MTHNRLSYKFSPTQFQPRPITRQCSADSLSEDLSEACVVAFYSSQVETRLYCPVGADRCTVYIALRPERCCQLQLGHTFGRKTAALQPPSDRDGKNIMSINKQADAPCTQRANTALLLFPYTSRQVAAFRERPFPE